MSIGSAVYILLVCGFWRLTSGHPVKCIADLDLCGKLCQNVNITKSPDDCTTVCEEILSNRINTTAALNTSKTPNVTATDLPETIFNHTNSTVPRKRCKASVVDPAIRQALDRPQPIQEYHILGFILAGVSISFWVVITSIWLPEYCEKRFKKRKTRQGRVMTARPDVVNHTINRTTNQQVNQVNASQAS